MFELKVTRITKTDKDITVTIRLFRTVGPFPVDRPGRASTTRYDRTMLVERTFTVSRPINRAQIMSRIRTLMENYNNTHGREFQLSDFYVNVTSEATNLED
jgi:hypothetical protein